jgi:hypothetical protein
MVINILSIRLEFGVKKENKGRQEKTEKMGNKENKI